MKHYHYHAAVAFLEKHFDNERLDDALEYLDWSDEQAAEMLSPLDLENGLYPVWTAEELLAFGEDDEDGYDKASLVESLQDLC